MIGRGKLLWYEGFFIESKQIFHEVSFFDLSNGYSFCEIGLHAFEDQRSELWCNFGFDMWFFHDVYLELIFGFALVKRSLAMQELINHDAK